MLKTLLGLLAMLATIPSIASAAQDEIATGPNIEKAEYFRRSLAPERTAPGDALTIVYFMDYQCPACRRFTPDVSRVLKQDRRIRVIYRDTPIFGPRSMAAARVAIASQFQGKHEALHAALMATKLPLDDIALRSAADAAGVDWARLQRDLSSHGAEIDALIARNLELSEAAGVSGTPGFIIGQTLFDGALNEAQLKAEIADARSALKPSAGPQEKAIVKPAVTPPPAADAPVPAAAETKVPTPVAARPAPIFVKDRTAQQQSAPESRGALPWLWLALAAIAVGILGLAIARRWRSGRQSRRQGR